MVISIIYVCIFCVYYVSMEGREHGCYLVFFICIMQLLIGLTICAGILPVTGGKSEA